MYVRKSVLWFVSFNCKPACQMARNVSVKFPKQNWAKLKILWPSEPGKPQCCWTYPSERSVCCTRHKQNESLSPVMGVGKQFGNRIGEHMYWILHLLNSICANFLWNISFCTQSWHKHILPGLQSTLTPSLTAPCCNKQWLLSYLLHH